MEKGKIKHFLSNQSVMKAMTFLMVFLVVPHSAYFSLDVECLKATWLTSLTFEICIIEAGIKH